MPTAIIIGGGAAGFFAAITCAEANPGHSVIILEATGEVLAKVRISGGGRCNVTHDCLEPKTLVGNYPRGTRELLGPFSRFGPRQVIAWFEGRGVELKVEEDGRMFPTTDSSQTIIDCLTSAAEGAGVQVRTHAVVKAVSADGARWRVELANETIIADAVLLATGSGKSGHKLAEARGHTVVTPVPSLFTFTIPEPWIRELAGLSVENVHLTLLDLAEEITTRGPLLCTHWGFSGPAALRASAWGARLLATVNYRCRVRVDWLGGASAADWCAGMRNYHGAKLPKNAPPSAIPRRLWDALLLRAGVVDGVGWAQLTKEQMEAVAGQLNACTVAMTGKSTFKNEFVTAGGVAREKMTWRTMESRKAPGVFIAGECLDVDAITGGFNFQNAWTSGWLAGNAMAERLGTATD
ncbi:MAG TPA: NAD(P)/FAD-dependent oxidoreductase [Planctomycetota bacterium]|nr:NAD(P)/FAD-dependent oxidoreductase [Planctomycetota bacterium]